METSTIKSSLARFIGAPITKSSQEALQADGLTPFAVVGETRLILSRSDKHLALHVLDVDNLEVDVLADVPFLLPTISLFALLSAYPRLRGHPLRA